MFAKLHKNSHVVTLPSYSFIHCISIAISEIVVSHNKVLEFFYLLKFLIVSKDVIL